MGEPIGLWNMLYLTVMGTTIMLLMADSRLSARCTAAAAGALLAVLMAGLFAVERLLGFSVLLKLYTLLVHVPSLVFFLWVSRSRNWQTVFQLLSSILFCFLIHQWAALCYLLSGERFWALTAGYICLSAAIILFLIKYLRPLARQTFAQIRRGWGLMCLLLAGCYAINIYLIPDLAGVTLDVTVLKCALSLLMSGVYAVFLHLLNSLRREMETQHNAAVTALQLDGLRKRIAGLQDAEEALRLERHDLRHRLQTAQELVRLGREQEALDFLDTAQARLEEGRPEHWCQPPVLDAVFSVCFQQARQQDILVEADLSLPSQLPVDEGELAVVLSNALENAINANLKLPAHRRRIFCKAVGFPSVMLEIANPCDGIVPMDANGLPVAQQPGHGLGVRSISTFCLKYGAVCRFEQEEGWFRVQLVL